MLTQGAERAQAIVKDSAEQPRGLDMLMSIVPDNVVGAAADNSILALMFFALMFGIGLVLTPTPATEALKHGMQGLFEVCMTLIGLVIRLAPYAVVCFMFNLARAASAGTCSSAWAAFVGVGGAGAGDAHVRGAAAVAEVHGRHAGAHVLPRQPGSDADGVLHRLHQRRRCR